IARRMLTMARPTVLLPHPDSPTRPSVSPLWSSRLTPSTALTSAILRAKTPPTTGNRTQRLWISISFSISVRGTGVIRGLIYQMTPHPMSRRSFDQLGLDRLALLQLFRTSGDELATNRQVQNARHIAGN